MTTAALGPNPPAATPAPNSPAAATAPALGPSPATQPPLPPLSARSALLPVETIEVSRQTALSGTLESQPEPLPADLHAASNSLADPQPVSRPQPARVAKVDPMVTQTALTASQTSQPARPAVPVQATRPAPGRHLVRPGEDFSSIARDYYGSPRLARALWWVNRKTVAWPGALAAGTRIVIPPIEQLEGGSARPQTSRPAIVDPQVRQASQSRPAEGVRGRPIRDPRNFRSGSGTSSDRCESAGGGLHHPRGPAARDSAQHRSRPTERPEPLSGDRRTEPGPVDRRPALAGHAVVTAIRRSSSPSARD